jgi:ATP phosphoribosyltransferase regulatory subunit
MQSFGIPQGMRDILADESGKRTILLENLRNYVQSCGFNRIETPLFEYYKLFSEEISPIDDENIIKTIDRDGRVVVLRPDMTIPAARVAATKLRGEQKPLKLFYIGNVYRAGRKSRGGATELCQIGAEIYGGAGKWADIEIINMAKECFREAEISDYKIDIGHAGIIKGIFKELSIPEEKKSSIIALVNEKNLVELEKEASMLAISERHIDIICKLPRLFGSPEDVFKGIDEIIINNTVKASVDYLFDICKRCSEMGIASKLIIDAGMTGSMGYYTGMIFRSYARGAGSAVISGGRYDDLLGKLGLNCPAAGFAADVDGMIKAEASERANKPEEKKILAIFSDDRFGEALEYSENSRKGGKVVNLINCSDIPDIDQYRRQNHYGEVVIFE